MEAKQDYLYSVDKDNNLIDIKNADRNNEYFCPCCGRVMIPKQGEIRKWHFAHKGNTENCSYESYLHKIAKRRIKEIFLQSSNFFIEYRAIVKCDVSECPLGCSSSCSGKKYRHFDLKEFYDNCEEEIQVGNYRADLILTSSNKEDRKPVFIEICVTHKSTEEKIQSGHKIIEICIKSEEDIEKIIYPPLILCESRNNDNTIRFYNFKGEFEEKPDRNNQADRNVFYIDSDGRFHFYNGYDQKNPLKCLDHNPQDIESSVYRIESKYKIGMDLAFYKLSQSKMRLRYCMMCEYYRYNNMFDQCICMLYNKENRNIFPSYYDAMQCTQYKLKQKYNRDDIQFKKECRVTSNSSDGVFFKNEYKSERDKLNNKFSYILLDILKDNFKIDSRKKREDYISLWFTERGPQLKENQDSNEVDKYDFTRYKTFLWSIQEKKIEINIRKIKWVDKDSGEIFCYQWNVPEKNEVTFEKDKDLVDFLRTGDRLHPNQKC